MNNYPQLFSGHETFALKYEWLRKLCEAGDSDLSKDEELIAKFGVGRNMLNSMRYWAKLSGLFEYDEHRRCITRANKWGALIFEEMDPYLEGDTTAWFLHWQIIFRGGAYTPFWLFCHNNTTIFDSQLILNEIKITISSNEKKALPADETLKRDIDTYLKCYCPKENKSNEENDYILSDLGLISHADDGTKRYRMSYQKRPTLNFQMFLFALIDYKKQYHRDRNFIHMDKIMYGESSPGRIFQLDESSINLYSEEIHCYTNEKIILDESSGVYQWQFRIGAEEMTSMQEDLFKGMY